MKVFLNIRNFLIFGCFASIFAFYLLTIRDGHGWGDDFSMYLKHAQNLVEGKPYAEPQFIVNPHYSTYAPRQYPAGYSIAITPLYALYKLNLTPYKVFNIILLCLSLGLVYSWLTARNRLPWLPALVVVVVIGFNAFYWEYKDSILSDFLFWLTLMLFFGAVDRFFKPEIKPLHAIGLGLLMFYVLHVRTLGVVLLPALLIWSILEYKKVLLKPLLWVFGSFLAGYLAQSLLMEPDDSFSQMLKLSYGWMSTELILKEMGNQAYRYFHCLDEFWVRFGVYQEIGKVMTLITTLLMFAGWVQVIRTKITLVEVFFAGYLIVLVAFPGYQGFRYLIPFMPFGVYYVLLFIRSIAHLPLKITVATLLAGVLVFLQVKNYQAVDFKTMPYGIQEPQNQELFAFIREKTPADAIFMCEKPRAIHLFTGRMGIVAHWEDPKSKLLEFCRTQQVGYLILPGSHISEMQQAMPDKFEKIYDNGWNQIYKITY